MSADLSCWTPLGNAQFRKIEIYSLYWDSLIDVKSYRIAVAPYAGPVACVRAEEPSRGGRQSKFKPIVYIFSSAGKEISTVEGSLGYVDFLAWSYEDDLLCIQNDGTVHIYNVFGLHKSTISFGQEAKDLKVKDVKVFPTLFGTGLAALSGAQRIWIITDIADVKIRRLPDIPGLNENPSAWAVVTRSQETFALVAKGKDLYSLDTTGDCKLQELEVSSDYNAIVEIAISINNRFIGFYTDTGVVLITTDFAHIITECQTNMLGRPRQLAWCGTSALVGYWNDELLVVGFNKDTIRYSLERGAVHLVPEWDCLRIISNHSHEILERVPSSVQEIYQLGSLSSSALLFEAYHEFIAKDPLAEEYIRDIRERDDASDNLDHAIDCCIEAAGNQWDFKEQKDLLKAASFAKGFSPNKSPVSFVEMCRSLRVLNAIRDTDIGIPLTYSQLQHFKISGVIDKLIYRRHFLLALEICKYVNEKEGKNKVLAHWAAYKVDQKDVDQDTIADKIIEKLGDIPHVSYSDIAERAIEKNRQHLAIRLLDYEVEAGRQVPLLMKMNEMKLALQKAVDSGDTDLVYKVVLELNHQLSRGEFFRILTNCPTAYNLYVQYSRSKNPKLLHDLYDLTDNRLELAKCHIRECQHENNYEKKLSALHSAQSEFQSAGAGSEWAVKQTEDQVKLLKFQHDNEIKLGLPLVGLSLSDTIIELIRSNQFKSAEYLRKEFKLKDKRFWYLKVEALSENGNFAELERFCFSKKSPIGYEPFVEACLKYNNPTEAEKYTMASPPAERARCLVRIGKFQEALDVVSQSKNEADLDFIQTKLGPSNKHLLPRIQQLREII